MFFFVRYVIFPLAVPFIIFLTFRLFQTRPITSRHKHLLITVALTGAVTAAIPYVGQPMYKIMPLPFIETIETASLFIFVFAATAQWTLLQRNRKRWFVVPLAVVALFKWALWAWVFVMWSIFGFAP